ncbi:pectinesterase-like [Syzygium oleosum]|uniref:pectinesterase-like n=1 Tax=Syzygium oleosum TaxID=219896 RepID=UPI0024B93EFB|nr:pectinesterase-like [Syzygium oleosum]
MSTLKVYLPITVFFILSLLPNLIATTTPRGRLQATRSTSQGAPYPDLRKMFDLVVAKDGSGNFTSINDAVAAAPSNSKIRFVIYIKEGVYLEYVMVNTTKTNHMFVGDGIGKTWIKGNRNYVDGWNTYRSATVSKFLNLSI